MSPVPSTAAPEVGREPWAVLAGIAAAACVGEIAPMVVPLFLGAVAADFAVTEGTAGIAPGVEVAGIATGSVVLALAGRRLHPRLAVWLALGLVVAGQVLSMVMPWWPLFAATRAVVGLGEGALVALANIQASLTPRPHRAFSTLLAVIIGLFIVVSIVIPTAVEAYGSRGAFAVLLAVAVAAMPFLRHFPARRGQIPHGGGAWWSPRAVGLLTAAVLVYVAFSAAWTYAGQVGLAVGLGLSGVGVVVTLSGAIGAVGPLGAGAVGLRWGHAVPLLGSLTVVAAAAALLSRATTVPVFTSSTVVVMASFMYFVTALRVLMGALDPSGRVVGVGVGVVMFGGALGPLVGGLVLDAGGGYGSLGVMALGCCAVAAILAAPVARRVDRQTMAMTHGVIDGSTPTGSHGAVPATVRTTGGDTGEAT